MQAEIMLLSVAMSAVMIAQGFSVSKKTKIRQNNSELRHQVVVLFSKADE